MNDPRLDLARLDLEIDARAATIANDAAPWPCKRGCDRCCRSLAEVPRINAAEWARLREGLALLPATVRSEVDRRLAALADGSAPSSVCAFLDPTEGACLVYAHRPTACRTYGFYAARDGGRWCAEIEARVTSGSTDGVVLGNHEAIDDRLVTIGGRPRSLLAWIAGAVFAIGCGSSPAIPLEGAPVEPPDAAISDDARTVADGLPPERPSDASAGDADHATDAVAAGPFDGPRPTRPASLVRFLVGSDDDRAATPTGPGLILMGGGPDVDEAFEWQRGLVAGGDVVVLRTDERSGYGPYLHDEIGGVDSVETLVVSDRALADDPYVAWTIAHAEAVFLTGGDQATYLRAWKGTAVARALGHVWSRGGVIGGTSAGCAVLGGVVYAAYGRGAVSSETLRDPFDGSVTLDRELVALPPLASVLTDTHFGARDRMGRLAVFLARAKTDVLVPGPILGLGIDEATALVVGPDQIGKVVGRGRVYALSSASAPEVCSAGRPLSWSDLSLRRLRAGETIALPSGRSDAPASRLDYAEGRTRQSEVY